MPGATKRVGGAAKRVGGAAKRVGGATETKKATKRASSGAKAKTKSEILATIAAQSGVTKDVAGKMLDSLMSIAASELKGSAGVLKLPGFLKIQLKSIPAKPARMGRNPATGETIQLKAKPASKGVKAVVLKSFKESVIG